MNGALQSLLGSQALSQSSNPYGNPAPSYRDYEQQARMNEAVIAAQRRAEDNQVLLLLGDD